MVNKDMSSIYIRTKTVPHFMKKASQKYAFSLADKYLEMHEDLRKYKNDAKIPFL